MEIPVNYLAVVVAAAAAFVFSWLWYAALSAVSMRGASREEKQKAKGQPVAVSFIIAAIAYLLMAWMLAGLMGHLANVNVRGGVLTAFFVWAGFVLTTTAVNQTFQNKRPVVTLVDAGNWLAVLAIMGAIVGAFGLPA
jgi:uncharacterized protein DUF1761